MVTYFSVVQIIYLTLKMSMMCPWSSENLQSMNVHHDNADYHITINESMYSASTDNIKHKKAYPCTMSSKISIAIASPFVHKKPLAVHTSESMCGRCSLVFSRHLESLWPKTVIGMSNCSKLNAEEYRIYITLKSLDGSVWIKTPYVCFLWDTLYIFDEFCFASGPNIFGHCHHCHFATTQPFTY